MAGAKDDRLDALVLADTLRTDHRLYRFLEPVHPTIIQLREWSRMTEDLSAERNRLATVFVISFGATFRRCWTSLKIGRSSGSWSSGS
jgi:hypothetical protein